MIFICAKFSILLLIGIMDEFHYKRYLEDSDNFSDAGAIYGFDVYQNADETKSTCSPTRLSPDNVCSWLKREDTFTGHNRKGEVARLRLICICHNRSQNQKAYQNQKALQKQTIPIPKDVFVQIMDQFQLSKLFLHLFMLRTAISHRYLEMHPKSDQERFLRFVIQTNASSKRYFSLALTYDSEAHVTTAMLLGAEEKDIVDISQREGAEKQDIVDLHQRLDAMKTRVAAPMLVPTILVEMKIDQINKRIDQCYEDIRDIKVHTGVVKKKHMRSDSWRSIGNNTATSSSPSDPREISKDLTRITARLAQFRQYTEVLQSIVNHFEEAGEHCATATTSEKHHIETANGLLKAVNTYNVKYLKSTTARTKFLMRRAIAYVQRVYNLIAQHQNDMYITISQQSLNIAQQSQIIAEAARKDAAAMQTISIVTMAFLPATFIATFFSTSFFNFRARQSETTVVSKLLWVYILVTAILTVIVFVVWAFLVHSKELHNWKTMIMTRAKQLPEFRLPGVAGGSLNIGDAVTEVPGQSTTQDDLENLERQETQFTKKE